MWAQRITWRQSFTNKRLSSNVDAFRVARSVTELQRLLDVGEEIEAKTKRKLKYDMIRTATLDLGKKIQNQNISLEAHGDSRATAGGVLLFQ